MKIQCPKCQSLYRSRVLSDSHSPLQVNCPKCDYRFLVAYDSAQELESEAPAKILIVDDARFFRELLLDMLVDRKAELMTADTAQTAWKLLHQHSFNLLIVDINLPDIDGLKLISRIRADGGINKHLKILCVSGVYRQSGDARKALLAGADDFTSKSFNPEELNRRIDNLLNQ